MERIPHPWTVVDPLRDVDMAQRHWFEPSRAHRIHWRFLRPDGRPPLTGRPSLYLGAALAGDMQQRATVLAELELFDPPAPLRDDDEAVLAIGNWLHLADDVMRLGEGRDPAE